MERRVTRTLTRGIGRGGRVSAGCETVADCPSVACIAGVCTLECSPDGQDTRVGPADGPEALITPAMQRFSAYFKRMLSMLARGRHHPHAMARRL